MWKRMFTSCAILGLLAAGNTASQADAPKKQAAAKKAKGKKQPKLSAKVYVLTCSEDDDVFKMPAKGLHWKTLHKIQEEKSRALIRVVDGATIDSSLYLDRDGLRLYVSSRECLERFGQLASKGGEYISLDYLTRSLLTRRYAATGIEPDRIPVQGEAGKKLGLKNMVVLDGGEYTRSGHYYTSQSTELGERRGDSYTVKVAAFNIDKYKVTNEEYCVFLNDGNPGYWNSAPWSNITRDATGEFVVEAAKAKWPVIAVNWYQASGYAEWAGKTLPTEAQWEYAAGGSEGRKYPWGNDAPDTTRGNYTGTGYTPVDAYPAGATPDGVYDLAGNAAEWCADFYSHTYYDKAPKDGILKNPLGPDKGSSASQYCRMFKGFCRAPKTPEFLECTKRHSRPPFLTAAIGFRCVKGCG